LDFIGEMTPFPVHVFSHILPSPSEFSASIANNMRAYKSLQATTFSL
jgi:hypothetical protein